MINELETMSEEKLRGVLEILEENPEKLTSAPRYSLLDFIYGRLCEAANVKEGDRVLLERTILRLLAEKLNAPHDPRTDTARLEEAVFAAYSREMAKGLKPAFRAALFVATGDDQLAQAEKQSLEEMIHKLCLHQDAKESLLQTLEQPLNWFATLALHDELEAFKDSQKARAVLSLCWAVASADGEPHPKEIERYFIVAEGLGVSSSEAATIAHDVSAAYEKALADEREAAQQVSQSVDSRTATSPVGPMAATAAALAAANASGFGIFLATTTGLHALSLLLGTTFLLAPIQLSRLP